MNIKISKKRAAKNLKRKGKKYNPHKGKQVVLDIPQQLHADTTTLVL